MEGHNTPIAQQVTILKLCIECIYNIYLQTAESWEVDTNYSNLPKKKEKIFSVDIENICIHIQYIYAVYIPFC